jgi:flagellar hook-associated protein 2
MALSIGGLGSGLDTQGIVNSLLQAEAVGQNKLKAAKGVVSVKAGAWTSLASIVKSLTDKATAVATPDTLRMTTASSSATGLATVTSDPTATPGALTFRINQLATRHQVASGGRASATDPVGAGSLVVSTGTGAIGATVTAGETATTGKYAVNIAVAADGTTSATVNGTATAFGTDAAGKQTLTVGGATLTFADPPRSGSAVIGVAATSATSSLNDLAAELAKNGGPASASVVNDGTATTPHRLVLASGETGLAGAVSLAASSNLADLADPTRVSTLTAALDAEVKIGDPTTGITVTSSSNAMTTLMPGVTVNLVKADPAADVTITVKKDDDGVVTRAKGLMESVNGLLTWIGTNTKYDVAGKKGGPMVGDPGVRALANQITEAMQTALPDGAYRTAGAVGLSPNKTGTYELDETKLRAALTADPEAVARMVSAVADAVAKVGKAAAGENGVIQIGIAGTEARTKDLQSRIEAWDVRLLAIKKRYERQFSALDIAMSRMSSQSNWLSSQLQGMSGGQS